jgi:FkbM family methyltransferase
VFCFEFEKLVNLSVLEGHLALNSDLSQRVTVVRRALWSRSGERLIYVPEGPGTSIAQHGKGESVDTLTIDDMVLTSNISRVGGIKLDIEGAELPTLHGAVETLRDHRPKLAISLYHGPTDLFTIPLFLKRLDLNYRFYLKHFTIHNEETVLFAIADESGADGGSAPT